MTIEIEQIKQELNLKIEILEQQIISLHKKLDVRKPVNRAPNRECYTVEDLVEITGYSEKTIQRYEKEGKIKVAYPNSKKRYLPIDVEHFLQGR